MSKDVKKKKSEETVQDEVKNQETDAKKEPATANQNVRLMKVRIHVKLMNQTRPRHRMRALRALRRKILRMQL